MKFTGKFLIVLLFSNLVWKNSFAQADYCYERQWNGFLNGEWVCGLYNEKDFRGCPTFTDIDEDGDLDLFFGYNRKITFYRNDGDSTVPCWEFISDFYQNIQLPFSVVSPAFGDVNGDGKKDLFVGYGQGGSNGGVVRLYLNDGLSTDPHFTFAADTLGMVDVGDNAKIAIGDLDNDNDLDLVIGGGFGHLVYLENIGDSVNYNFNSTPITIADIGWQAKPQLVDIDGDGVLELFARHSFGFTYLWENESGDLNDINNWILQTNSYGNFNSIAPTGGFAFADIDADMDLDLFSFGISGTFFFHRNEGNQFDTLWVLETPFYKQMGGGNISTFVDLDGDNLKEWVIGGGINLEVYRNEGTYDQPRWRYLPNHLADIIQGGTKSPAFYDYDFDGDQDLWVGISSTGQVLFYKNEDGNYSLVSDVILDNIDFGSWAHPVLLDVDFDGKLDLFVLGSEGFFHFINTANNDDDPFWAFQTSAYLPDLPTSVRKATFGDIDDDGDYDLLIGASSWLFFYRNVSIDDNPEFVLETDKFAKLRGTYPSLVDLSEDCGLELSIDGGTLYHYRGIKPGIVPLAPNVFCSNHPPIRLEAFPSDSINGSWGSTSPGGVFDPASGVGSYPVIYQYTDPFGCFTIGDTTAVFVNESPLALACTFDTFTVYDAPFELTCDANVQEVFSGPGVEDNIFDPAVAGEGIHQILYTLSNAAGCTDSVFITIVLQNSVSFQGPEATNEDLSVFPNPTNDLLYIHSLSDREKIKISCINIYGIKVFEKTVLEHVPDEPISFSALGLPKGIYVLRIENKKYQSSTKVFYQ